MPSRRILRFVTAMLLAWIAVDLAALDTCAMDLHKQPARAQASVGPAGFDAAPAHSHTASHPDHCFCHGLSTGADSPPAVMAPFFGAWTVPDAPPGHLLQSSAALDHPPQLAA